MCVWGGGGTNIPLPPPSNKTCPPPLPKHINISQPTNHPTNHTYKHAIILKYFQKKDVAVTIKYSCVMSIRGLPHLVDTRTFRCRLLKQKPTHKYTYICLCGNSIIKIILANTKTGNNKETLIYEDDDFYRYQTIFFIEYSLTVNYPHHHRYHKSLKLSDLIDPTSCFFLLCKVS